MGQFEKVARCWHLRKLIWDLLSHLRSPDGLGTGVQVEVGEVSGLPPRQEGLWRQELKRLCQESTGGHPLCSPCLVLAPCSPGISSVGDWAPLPWPLKLRGRPRFSLSPELCHPGSHRCLDWSEPLARQMSSVWRPGQRSSKANLLSPPTPFHPAGIRGHQVLWVAHWGQRCWGPLSQILKWDPSHHAFSSLWTF